MVTMVISTMSIRESVVVAGDKLSNVRSFRILQSGEVLTSLNNDNSATFSGEKGLHALWFDKYNRVYFTFV